jgi:hypothetical protein
MDGHRNHPNENAGKQNLKERLHDRFIDSRDFDKFNRRMA